MFKNINITSIFIIFVYLLCYANTKVCYVKMPKAENQGTENPGTENQESENQEPENQGIGPYGCYSSSTNMDGCWECCYAGAGYDTNDDWYNCGSGCSDYFE